MNLKRATISFTMGAPMRCWRSVSCNPSKNARHSRQDMSQTCWMFLSPTVTARYSGLSLAPWHVGHGTSRMYLSRWLRVVSDVVS